MNEDRIRFVWTTNDGSIFSVNFVENKIVGFDENAIAGQRQDNNQSVTSTVYFLKTEW